MLVLDTENISFNLKGIYTEMKNTVKTILVSASVVAGMFILGTQANADTVTVASGDTVSKIAQDTGDTVSHIASVNHLADPDVIQVGEKLQVGTSEANSSTYKAYKGYTGVTNTVTSSNTSQAQNKPSTGYTQSTSGSVAQQAAQLMAQKTGVSASEWSQIIQRESNGNVSAQNSSSSAHGLFQRLGETSNDWRTQVNNAAELYHKQGLNAWSATR